MTRVFIAMACLASCLPAARASASDRAGRSDRPPSHRVVIARAAVNASGFLVIGGRHFGRHVPRVVLDDGELQVHSHSPSEIVAMLPGDIAPGSYQLIVWRGPAITDAARFVVTLGAVGPQGEPGPAGPPGVTPEELAAFDARITGLSSTVTDVQAAIGAHAARLNQQQAQLNPLLGQVAQLNAAIAALQQQVSALRADVNLLLGR